MDSQMHRKLYQVFHFDSPQTGFYQPTHVSRINTLLAGHT